MEEALRFRILSLAALMLSTLSGGMAAQTASSDSFDYQAVGGDLLGEDGGSGFSGPWFASGLAPARRSTTSISAMSRRS